MITFSFIRDLGLSENGICAFSFSSNIKALFFYFFHMKKIAVSVNADKIYILIKKEFKK